MKILMISPGSPSSETSGAGVAIHKIANRLATKVSLTIIQPEDVNTKEVKVSTESFTNTSVVKDITRINIKSQVGPYAYTDSEEKEVQKEVLSKVRKELSLFTKGVIDEVDKHDFDLIYAHDWVSFEAALKIKEVSKKPLILHVHSLDVDRISSINHSWVFDLEQRAFEQSDLIIAVSKLSASRIQQHYGIHVRKIKVIHHGVDLPTADVEKKKFKDPIVLFAGRLSGQKGPQTFINIAEKILSTRDDVRFVVAGDGELKNDLLEMAAHKGIGHKVNFTGYLRRDEMDEVYGEASVLCMPSVSEPFGLVATEAAANKVPVVLSKNFGAAEVLPEAILVDHQDVEGFARSIISVLDDHTIAAQIIEGNLNSIKKANWDKTSDEIIAVINSMN